ncbi:MAG: hypothetical protein IJS17_04485, partial [Clostridia bacterium]|nr:hypothetical protein [Clostridia bacterium]
MSKTKKLISLALTLLMVINIFSVVAFAEDDLADYSSLTSYIEKNVPINNDAGIYSAESYAPVENTLNSIDYELPASDQATVDGYLSTLQTAVAGLVADESKAVAEFSLSGTSSPLHPGDTVTVTFGLNTNYRVISAGAVIIFDSTKFELVGGSTINNNVVHYSEGVFSAYSLTGSASNTAKIFSSRNSNTAYWNTDEMKAQYTALSVGFSLNSKVSDPVVANGTVATITFRVLSEAQFGTEGSIFINSDFNKTSSFAGGLNYAARSVGEKMGPVSSTVTVGQTFDLDDAQLTLSVNHTPVTDSAVAPTCTETGLTEGSHCSVCGEVLTAQETVEALGHSWGEWAVTTAASCTEAGVETRVCANDENHTETRPVAALGHDYQAVVTAPTCTEGGYTTYTCSRCGDSYVADETEALGHAWNDGVVTTAPTCTQAGVKTYTCQNDSSHTYTEEITALGHNWGEWAVTTEASCTEAG